MIKYNLKCSNNHEFESWFSDSNEFEKLDKKKLLECIYCSSKKISKSIMAPMVSVVKEKNNDIKNLKKLLSQEKDKLLNLRNYIEKNFEYVGENFTEEAKKIKYGESEDRPIYGEATIKETKELIDEEINVTPLPFQPNKKNN